MSLIPYDDRDGLIWYNGKMVPWREAKFHFLTHTFHYGGGVFEGERVYNGVIFKLNEHSQRLIDGCKIMDIPFDLTVEQINAACNETVKANNIVDGYVRPLIWRGAEQMGVSSLLTKTHFAIATWEWPSYFKPEAKENGLKLITSKWRRPAPDCAPVHAKACGLYMICTMSKNEAERQGCNDALMLDYRGQVAELTGANFFMVRNGEIHTPKPDCFLDGITRRTVIDLAKAEGFKIIERAIMPEELKDADECFATGTAAEVIGIGQIDDLKFKVGPVTKKLAERYMTLVRGGAEQKKAAGAA